MIDLLFTSVGRRAELLSLFKSEFQNFGRIVAADQSNTAPALYAADLACTLPPIMAPDYIDIVLELCKKENIRGISTLIDPEILPLTKNAKRFEHNNVMVFHSSLEVSELCFDKYETFQFLSRNGFMTPLTFPSFKDFSKAYDRKEIDFPVFVKPRTGSGSVGIEKIESLEELQRLFGKRPEYIVQEYMDVEEYDADVYVDKISGKLVSAFTKKKLSSRIGGADKTVSFKDPLLLELIERFVEKIGLSGPCDIDLFKKDGEYYISEINPRFGGAYLHAHACGVNFPKLVQNNLRGRSNECQIGNYEEGIYMMMYDSVVFKKETELVI